MIWLCRAIEDSPLVLRRLAAKGVSATSQPARWLYLGRNYPRLVEWETALGERFERISYAKRLQELAAELRKPYLDWITHLGTENNSLEWWSSRIAERNTLLDSLFHAICYLRIALTVAAENPPPTLIVAENPAVLRAIAESPNLRGRTQFVRTSRTVMDECARWLLPCLRWLHYFASSILALWDARRTCQGSPYVPRAGDKPRVLIHTCMDETYFSPDGTGRDRYFSGLADELRRRGYEVLTVPWLSQISRSRRQAFEWFRQRPCEYVIPEDFYSFADYVWAAGVVLRQALLPRGKQRFQGLDITHLVSEARFQQLSHPGTAKFVRYHRLVEKWAKLGLKADIFIDMFENMLTEKPAVLGLRKWMPDVTTVGFQHYMALHPLMLCLFTTREEATFAPHPDVIVCNSPFTAKQLVQAGFPAAKIRVGPSLRYLELPAARDPQRAERNTVVVVMSLDPMASKELLWKLLGAFPVDEGIRFWLKLHPMMSRKEFYSLLSGRPLPPHMTCVEGALDEWVARAECALAVATTAAFELALTAIPFVLVGRETDFDMNPLAWFPDWDSPAYSEDELRAAVLKKLSLPPADLERLKQWAAQMRQECFSPLSEKSLASFVLPRTPVRWPQPDRLSVTCDG